MDVSFGREEGKKKRGEMGQGGEEVKREVCFGRDNSLVVG